MPIIIPFLSRGWVDDFCFHFSFFIFGLFKSIFFVNWILLIFSICYKILTNMLIIIVFRFRPLLFLLLSFPRDQSRDVTPHLGEGVWFFIFDYSSPFCFFVNWISFWFFHLLYRLTCYVYYYCIWLGFNTLFSCFFAGFLLLAHKGSVTGCDSSLGSFCYSPVYFLSRMHLHSGYYYYDYAIFGVLRAVRLIWSSLFNLLCCVLWR